MKKLVYIFLLLSLSGLAQGKFKHVKTIEGPVDFFTTDNQCNIYVVSGNELSKYDKSGKLLYKFSNKKYGAISFVDASNMLRILVFYKDFAQAIFLDNTLSLNTEPVSFDKLGFLQTTLVCESYNSGIWVYDPQNFALVRLSQTYEKLQQTANLSGLLNVTLEPNLMMEHDNKLYVANPASGILIFDVYGTYFKTIPVKNVSKFQPIGDWVYYLESKKVKAYNIKTTEEKEFEMPVNDFKNFRLELDNLVLQLETGIAIYVPE